MTGRAVSDDGPYVDLGLGRLVDELADRYSRLTFAASSAPPDPSWRDHRLALDPRAIVRLPSMPTTLRGITKSRKTSQMMRRLEEQSDLLVIQLPFPAPLALLRQRRPRVYHLCADPGEVGRHADHYAGVRRPFGVAAAMALEHVYGRLIDRPDIGVVANGEGLRAKYSPTRGRTVVSTTLKDEEIGSVSRTRSMTGSFRILFVGRLSPEKGLDDLVEAFREVRSVIPDVELVLVGPEENRSTVRSFLAGLAGESGATLTGPIPWGPRLFQQYADADVLVLPSRSEGTPRVLVEARAFGCPIVASRVGGIPTSVDDGVDGLLVQPGEPVDLARAILRIARDAPLRRSLIDAGLRRARQSTVECFVDSLCDEIEAVGAVATG